MKIFLTDQAQNLKDHLDALKVLPVMNYKKEILTKKISTIEINTTKAFLQINLDFLFEYKIFPQNILSFKSQWQDENREMKIGDTIAQQVCIPPIRLFSQKIIFGVRVSEIINDSTQKGFSYETLEGHVERGVFNIYGRTTRQQINI